MKITQKKVINSIKNDNITLKDIKIDTKACTGTECKEKNPSGKCCSKDIKELIKIYGNNIDNITCICCK